MNENHIGIFWKVYETNVGLPCGLVDKLHFIYILHGVGCCLLLIYKLRAVCADLVWINVLGTILPKIQNIQVAIVCATDMALK